MINSPTPTTYQRQRWGSYYYRPQGADKDHTPQLQLQDVRHSPPEVLGLVINQDKSHLQPTQRIQFIGAILDTTRQKAYLPEDRFSNLKQAITTLQHSQQASAWAIQSILGHMSSTTNVTPFARLRMRPLQNWFIRTFDPLHDPQSRVLHPPHSVLHSLIWWTKAHNVLLGIPFNQPRPSASLTTDASNSGWGAHLKGFQVSGHWTRQDQKFHINALEMMAVEKALRAFVRIVSNRMVQIVTDNTAVKYYINKQGGTRSQTLLSVITRIWEWCIQHNVLLTAIHLPGQDNILADSLSRTTKNNHEWHLHPTQFKLITRKWGTPRIDLFASPLNTHCPLYCARLHPRASPGCLGDAFLFHWTPGLLYIFPPLPLLSPVIAKIIQDKSDCILITPWWPRQHWFAPLLLLSNSQFLKFNPTPDLLTVENGLVLHPDLQSLRLTAWRIKPQ
ncbi:uncharacterized protein [Anolis sagrei]|uniref:uncharacterized protein n=1 Tax=Anolis sagrei TaxID=38937 RepID=UPI003520BFA2